MLKVPAALKNPFVETARLDTKNLTLWENTYDKLFSRATVARPPDGSFGPQVSPQVSVREVWWTDYQIVPQKSGTAVPFCHTMCFAYKHDVCETVKKAVIERNTCIVLYLK